HIRKELIGRKRSGSGRLRRGGRRRRLLLVRGNERFGSDDQFVVLLQFEFGFALRRRSRRSRRRLLSGRKSRRRCLVERHGDWLIFGFGSAFSRRRCKLCGKLFQRGRRCRDFDLDGDFEFGRLFESRRRGRFGWRGLARSRSRFLEHGGPFVGQINFLFGRGSGSGGNGLRLGLPKRNGERFFLCRWGSGLLCGGLRLHAFFGGNSRGALEAATKFAETLGTARFAPLFVNLLKLSGEFGRAAVISRAKNEIEKLFKGRRVARSTAENCFEQADCFLGQTVAGKKIDVRKRLRNEFLCFSVNVCFHERRSRSPAGSARLLPDGIRFICRNSWTIGFCNSNLKGFLFLLHVTGFGLLYPHFDENVVELTLRGVRFRLL